MKDYEANIIPYRGGKALLIDSFDFLEMRSRSEVNLMAKLIEDSIESVDYVLVISSMPPSMVRPVFRKWFKAAPIYCYRHTTKRGRKLNTKRTDMALKILFKTVERGPNEP